MAQESNVPDTLKANSTTAMRVEKMPEFPGGEKALLAFIKEHVKYPPKAKRQGVEGKVIASFVVEKDGRVNEVKVLKPVNPLLDAEVIRVVSKLPDFSPGTVNGVPVRVMYKLPISFSLSESESFNASNAGLILGAVVGIGVSLLFLLSR